MGPSWRVTPGFGNWRYIWFKPSHISGRLEVWGGHWFEVQMMGTVAAANDVDAIRALGFTITSEG